MGGRGTHGACSIISQEQAVFLGFGCTHSSWSQTPGVRAPPALRPWSGKSDSGFDFFACRAPKRLLKHYVISFWDTHFSAPNFHDIFKSFWKLNFPASWVLSTCLKTNCVKTLELHILAHPVHVTNDKARPCCPTNQLNQTYYYR